MARYEVTLGKAGGGSGTMAVEVTAATPDEARRIAQAQYAGYVAHAVRRVSS